MCLKRHNLTYLWLISQLKSKGLVTDKTEMSSVMGGVRKGAKAERIVKESVEVLKEYEQRFVYSEESND
jgi:hypothetical protein